MHFGWVLIRSSGSTCDPPGAHHTPLAAAWALPRRGKTKRCPQTLTVHKSTKKPGIFLFLLLLDTKAVHLWTASRPLLRVKRCTASSVPCEGHIFRHGTVRVTHRTGTRRPSAPFDLHCVELSTETLKLSLYLNTFCYRLHLDFYVKQFWKLIIPYSLTVAICQMQPQD